MMNMRLFSFIVFFSLFVHIISTSSLHAETREQNLTFNIMRNGEKIGLHQIQFNQNKGTLNVRIKTDVEVKILIVTAYKFHHSSLEIWKNGILTNLQSITDDDGTDHQLNLTRSNQALSGVADGHNVDIYASQLPASLWNQQVVNAPSLINTLQGQEMKIHVNHIGREEINLQNHTEFAEHYKLSGELERELWFNDQHNLVKMRFKGSDDSEIIYELI